MIWKNSEGICERKTLFRTKKEADQVEFKGMRTRHETTMIVGLLLKGVLVNFCFFCTRNYGSAHHLSILTIEASVNYVLMLLDRVDSNGPL